jgi:uncharacterized protein YndB with AHSA1/START domain
LIYKEDMQMTLKTKVSGRIAKPVAEVFEAVVNPDVLSKFFTTGQGTKGRLVAGTMVTWDFHDFPGAFPVKVTEVVANRRIVLAWPSQDDAAEGAAFVKHDNTVTFEFEQLEDGRTLVTISEEGWGETPKGIKAAMGNTEGWTGCLIAMKVWLERGINLREGFYK